MYPRPLKIFWEGSQVGLIRDPQCDMGHIDGTWESTSAEGESRLRSALGTATIRENIIQRTGVLIEWSEFETRFPGLFCGFDNKGAHFRMLTHDLHKEIVKHLEKRRLASQTSI